MGHTRELHKHGASCTGVNCLEIPLMASICSHCGFVRYRRTSAFMWDRVTRGAVL